MKKKEKAKPAKPPKKKPEAKVPAKKVVSTKAKKPKRRGYGVVTVAIVKVLTGEAWRHLPTVAGELDVTPSYIMRLLRKRGVQFERRVVRTKQRGRPASEVRIWTAAVVEAANAAV